MEGTYKCFYEHKLSNNTLENIGFQDITYDINFSDLIEEGEKIGFKNIKYTTQGQFLVDFGILDVLQSYTELENEFSAGHTNLQEIRMNNETLLDEMRQREYKLKKLDREIKEKAKKKT